MIYLITGVPGSGKTLYAVSTLVKKLLAQKLRYRGKDLERPLPVDLGVFASLRDALGAVFELILPGQSVGRCFLPRFKDFFFLAAETPPPS